ncbi:MAG: ABC transporter substrate-binding protein, partial [Achromobacter mucicolens]
IKLLNYMIQPKHQAELSKYIAYGPTTEQALPLIDAKRLERLPSTTERLKKSIFLNSEFWDTHGPAITERYNQVRAR